MDFPEEIREANERCLHGNRANFFFLFSFLNETLCIFFFSHRWGDVGMMCSCSSQLLCATGLSPSWHSHCWVMEGRELGQFLVEGKQEVEEQSNPVA